MSNQQVAYHSGQSSQSPNESRSSHFSNNNNNHRLLHLQQQSNVTNYT